jgi:hypothetical protein
MKATPRGGGWPRGREWPRKLRPTYEVAGSRRKGIGGGGVMGCHDACTAKEGRRGSVAVRFCGRVAGRRRPKSESSESDDEEEEDLCSRAIVFRRRGAPLG